MVITLLNNLAVWEPQNYARKDSLYVLGKKAGVLINSESLCSGSRDRRDIEIYSLGTM